jgi:hypothetical protein
MSNTVPVFIIQMTKEGFTIKVTEVEVNHPAHVEF